MVPYADPLVAGALAGEAQQVEAEDLLAFNHAGCWVYGLGFKGFGFGI